MHASWDSVLGMARRPSVKLTVAAILHSQKDAATDIIPKGDAAMKAVKNKQQVLVVFAETTGE